MDQTKCIGCHACTVACKAEHDVPVGAFRTWVEYTERGTFPDTSLHFQVNRCNHCEDAPCVDICPTNALFKRPDGIVDFNNEICIGCKGCMAACPYDAIYIDPVEHTAAKCNYCAHRIDNDMLPACVVVCPEKAIIAGDLDDPTSEIAKALLIHPTSVRKAEQGTKPKVFYRGADQSTLDPILPTVDDGYRFSAKGDVQPISFMHEAPARPGTPRKAYDTPHDRRPWGPLVSLYLWTKSLSAGVGGLAALLAILHPSLGTSPLVTMWVPASALLFLLVTTALLIGDLKKPGRFWYMLIHPHWTSWLVKGGLILTAYGVLMALWLLFGILGVPLSPVFLAVSGAVAVMTAGYSAFLFAQAEGRDFWQNPLVFWHLITQAALGGSGLLTLAGGPFLPVTGWIFALALAVHLMFTFGDLYSRHPSREAALAAKAVTRGPLRRPFWAGVVAAGGAGALGAFAVALTTTSPVLLLLAAVLGLFGLLVYEHLWVEAGQIVPLS